MPGPPTVDSLMDGTIADDWNVWSRGNDILVGQRHRPVDPGRLVLCHVASDGYETFHGLTTTIR